MLIGRALSSATVTLAGNTIRFTAALPPTMTITGGATAITKDVTPTHHRHQQRARSSPVTVTIAGQTLSTTVALDGSWTVTAATSPPASTTSSRRSVRPAATAPASQALTVEVSPPLVDLGAAATYSVLASTGVVNTGVTHLSGDLGVSPSPSVTGFGPPGPRRHHPRRSDRCRGPRRPVAALDDASSRTRHTEIVGDLAAAPSTSACTTSLPHSP